MRICAALVMSLLFAATASAQTVARKPPVPPGAPTRGFAVALLSGGIDYTRPAVAAKLARDGEGEIIGWDVIDDDRRPYAATGIATRMVEMSPVFVLPFRLDTTSPASWTAALLALARSPARIAVVAVDANDIDATALAAMAAVSEVLFIVPAGSGAGGHIRRPANVIIADALPAQANADLVIAPLAATREAPADAAAPTTAYEAAVLAAALPTCTDLRSARSPADVKRLLLSRATPGPPGSPPMHAACP